MTLVLATLSEKAYVNGLTAIIFLPYLSLAAAALVRGSWRRYLATSTILYLHAAAVIAYGAYADQGVHRGDAGLGDLFLIIDSAVLNLIGALITAALAWVDRPESPAGFIWLVLEVAGLLALGIKLYIFLNYKPLFS